MASQWRLREQTNVAKHETENPFRECLSAIPRSGTRCLIDQGKRSQETLYLVMTAPTGEMEKLL